ncbi:hypothetical protein GO491_02960, partial [Flavobacteriaceae bacterium Ap0902]|nr:hypothetical protein [Flavobacteriaceae bacterium Ap0902]
MKKLLLSFLTILMFSSVMLGQVVEIYVSQNRGSFSNNGESWSSPYATMKQAFTQIGANTGTFNIYVAQGSYLLDGNNGPTDEEVLLVNGQIINIYGGYATPDTNGNIPGEDADAFPTVFDTEDVGGTSAFRVDANSNAKLTIKDVTIKNARGGGNYDGSFLTFDTSLNASLTLDNVNVEEWEGGGSVEGKGFIYVYNSVGTDINIMNSVIKRSSNEFGNGQFVVSDDNTADLDLLVENSIFNNIRGVGVSAELFHLPLNCNTDNAQSTIIFRNSEFYNVKRGLAAGQSAAILWARNFPYVEMDGNIFAGNNGGRAGVMEIESVGYFYSHDNIYQENTGGQGPGAVFIFGNYGCTLPAGREDVAIFENDQFFTNQGGYDGLNGRGGAIHVSGALTGAVSSNKEVRISSSNFYDNYTSAFDGGAVYIYTSVDASVENSTFCNNQANRWFTGNSAGSGGGIFAIGSGELRVTNSTFRGNNATSTGGAVATNKDTAVFVACNYFEDNRSRAAGGAIWSQDITTIDGAEFINNISNTNGGGVYIALNDQHTISNVTFQGNRANNGGGLNTYYAGVSPGNLMTLTDVYFISNIATNNGGGYYVDDFAVTTNNVVYDGNTAEGRGGAFFVGAGGAHDYTLGSSTYINNRADEGGAISMQINANGTAELTNNVFQYNDAATRGGAMAIFDVGLNDEIDVASGNKFFGNTLNGDSNNTNRQERSDIYLYLVTGIYYVGLGDLTNNELQFAPTTANYPSSGSRGYQLGSGNAQATEADDTTYTAYSCIRPVECVLPEPVAPTPVVVSAEGIDTGNPNDYTSYTEVSVGGGISCTPNATEVGFSARSNNYVRQDRTILNDPIAELEITYTIIKTNLLTGAEEVTPGNVISRSSANLSRIEEDPRSIPAATEGSSNTRARDLYRTYFIDVSNDIQSGYSYVYTITGVRVIEADGNTLEFTYTPRNYRTTIITDFCDSD